MQDELLTLQSKMKKTIIFITHDLNEAIKLGDRIAIMKDGEIVQTGTSEEILTEPANAYVERFVENVDRSKIITASSIMADKPLVARLKKEGPEVLIRKMRERNLTVLPVVDAGNILVGEVRLNDLLKLRKEQIRSIDTVVRHEVHSVLSDTILEDILPLMTRTNSPIWVVNENREFQGVVPLSSLIIEVTGKNKEELVEYGYIKRKRTDKKAKIKSKPFHYISSDGYHMYVGKNNYQNEELTFKFATGNDWWFHAKGMPGSHVVVKTNNETDLPDRMFEEAGKLAGYYSSGRDSDKIEIDYLQKKNVKKPERFAPERVADQYRPYLSHDGERRCQPVRP